MATFTADARKFIAAFASIIIQSAAHIYLSALPFAPACSKVSQHFLPLFQRTLSVQIGRASDWPPTLNVIPEPSGYVYSVMFSPDDRYIISGGESTVCIWDAETGGIIAGPFESHTRDVNSVMFSPDGKHVVSGSLDETIFILDVETGLTVVRGPIRGHADYVNSVAFSPDGKFIVSGSEDKTICIWHADTGTLAYGPIKGHTQGIISVAFSPDGRRVVSGSDDQTIRVWDVVTGAIVAGPFQHNGIVHSVTFSPDGKHIVSSSSSTIHIWDVKTGSCVSQWHNEGVMSTAYSKDGKHIISSSNDWTISIWNADTGTHISGPFRGHTRTVTSVASSSHGKRAVSGSYDGTIRTWDVESSVFASGPHKGESHTIQSVAFSPDGKHVVSGSGMTGEFTSGMWRPEHLLVSLFECTPISSHLLHSHMMVNASCLVHVMKQFASGMLRPVQLFLVLS